MLSNFFKIALRSFWKHRGFTLINVLGLAAGLATCLLILLFIQDEQSYDQHFEEGDRVYRLEGRYHTTRGVDHWAASQGHVIPEVTRRYPAIAAGVKVMPLRQPIVLHYEEKQFNEEGFIFADSAFFDIFSFEWLHGSPEGALSGPNKIVITEDVARRYFGDTDVVGKVFTSDYSDFMIKGVIKNPLPNAHFHFDLVASMDDLRQRWPNLDEDGPSTFYSYVKLNDPASLAGVQERLKTDYYEIMGIELEEGQTEPEDFRAELFFHNIRDIHLGGNAEKEWEANNEKTNIYIFSIIAILVLLIASFNYMNLATARSMSRAREVGVRKVLGAHRRQLFAQFMAESLMMTFVAMGLALLAVKGILPMFNELVGKSLELNLLGNVSLLAMIGLIWVMIGLFSGAYPALFLSSFSPLTVLKSNQSQGKNKGSAIWLRRSLVVAQFFFSIALIIGALTVSRQLHFIQHKHLGFSKTQVAVIPLAGRAVTEKLAVLEEAIEKIPEAISSTPTSTIPGKRVHIMGVRIPALAEDLAPGEEGDRGGRGMRIISVDEEVEETFGFEIVDGRGLSKDFVTDNRAGFLLNEAAVREYGLEDPVGQPFEYTYGLDTPKVGTIVGIVKDFHYASLHTEVEPLMMHVWPQHYSFLSVKLQSNNMSETLDQLASTWASVVPSVPFDFFFLDDNYDKMYRTEISTTTIVTYFTALAILIACLGLFGLAAFTAQRRTREIGIRKVLGASVQDIVLMLSRNFALMVLIACVLAIPLSWWLLSQWLDGFAYRIDLSLWIFVLAAVGALAIAVATVSVQAIRAAHVNPVEALKDE